MRTVSIKEAKDRLTALARRVEKGETIVVTRNGKPIIDLVPHRQKAGLKVAEVPVRYQRRRYGKSKISGTVWGSIRAGVKILWTIFCCWRQDFEARRSAHPAGS